MTLIEQSQFVVVDVETHKTTAYDGKKLLGVACAVADGTQVISHYFHEDFDELWQVLVGKEIICHNAAFDLRIIEENGCPRVEKFWDTMIMAHLVNENRFSYSLDNLAGIYLKEEKQDMSLIEKAFGGWENIPVNVMGDYACRDAYITMLLWIKLRGELVAQKLDPLWRHCARYTRTLQGVMAVGLPIDWTLLAARSAEARSAMARIEGELGFQPTKRKPLERELFEKHGLPVAYVTSSGKPELDDAALRAYALQYPEVKPLITNVLEYRAYSKANSTWYEGFLKFKTADGRIHPGLKQHGTATGRLSCSEPNLQQLPRNSSRVKKLFLPIDGHVLVEFDYSQIELRLASFYSYKMFDDDTMFNLYREGADVHTATTEMVGAFDQIEDRGEARQVGKTGNFLWIYGGGAERFRNMMWDQYNIAVTLEQAKEWTELFHQNYKGFRRASKYFETQNRTKGQIKMWNGRPRRVNKDMSHIAWNSVVQGGCGQILMHTMNLIDEAKLPSKMCLTVHDSILFHVPVDRVEEQTEVIKELMAQIPSKNFELPFEVDSKVW